MEMTKEKLASYFDHTALKPEATENQIDILCSEAASMRVAAVCVNPIWIERTSKLLRDTSVLPITVVGFPLGATSTNVKVFEAEWAISVGAREIDMVISIGELKSGKYDRVRADIASVKKACGRIPLKVIFETSLLSTDEIMMVSSWCAYDGVDFVKTSTGFGQRGATVEDIRLMKEVIAGVQGSKTKIKASGGIRNLADTLSMINAGAHRIGSSSTGSILAEFEKTKEV